MTFDKILTSMEDGFWWEITLTEGDISWKTTFYDVDSEFPNYRNLVASIYLFILK